MVHSARSLARFTCSHSSASAAGAFWMILSATMAKASSAVTTRSRVPVLPQVPSVAEMGFPDYEATTWFGVAAPRSTPQPIQARLREALSVVQRDPAFQERFGGLGLLIQPIRDEAALTRMIEGENRRWSQIIQARGIVLD